MGQNPNHRADKGFSRELAKVSSRTPATNKPLKQKISTPVKEFTWSKDVVAKPKPDAMATPRRLQNQSKVSAPKPEFTGQHRAYADAKKGIK